VRIAPLVLIAVVGCGDVPQSIPADADTFLACAGDEPSDRQLAELVAFLRDYNETNVVPGAAVAIARDGQLIHIATTGSKRELTCAPVTADTRFFTLFGKHLTAAAVIDAVDDGDASYDDRVTDFVPSFGAESVFPPDEITLHDLLTHKSGYSQSHTGSCLSVEDYFASVDSMPLWSAAGRIHLEMLLNVTLASRVLGDDLRGEVQRRVLDPLGLDGTYDRITALKGDFADGYAPDSEGLRPQPLDENECAPSEPYLGYLASIRDAGSFIAPLTTGDPEALVGREDSFYPPERATRGGFIRGPFDGDTEWAYAGNRAFGYAYHVAVVPDEGFAVVVFMNASHAQPADATLEAIRIFTGRTPTLNPTPQDAATLPSLAGTYVEPLTETTLEIATAGDDLEVRIDGADALPLVPARRDNSFIDDLFEFVRNDKPHQLRFWRDADGNGEVISEDTFRRALGAPFSRVQ